MLNLLYDAVDKYVTVSAYLSNYEPVCVSLVTHQSCLNNAFIVTYLQGADVVKLVKLYASGKHSKLS